MQCLFFLLISTVDIVANGLPPLIRLTSKEILNKSLPLTFFLLHALLTRILFLIATLDVRN